MRTQQQKQQQQRQKGGSIASDSVTSLVDANTFGRMDAMFSNKIGGCGCSSKKSGGSAFGNMMGSTTMETFFANVKSPSITVGMNSAPQILPPSAAANSKKAPNVKVNAAANSKAAPSMNASKAPSMNAASKASPSMNASKAPSMNAASKAAPSINASKAPSMNVVKAPNSSPSMNASSPKVGGNAFPSLSQLMDGTVGLFNVRHKTGGTRAIKQKKQNKQSGGNNLIGQNLNILNVPHSPRGAVNSSSASIMANEAVSGPMPLNKLVQYGSTSDLRSQPFSFDAASTATGGGRLQTWRKKAMQKLKSITSSTKKPKSKPSSPKTTKKVAHGKKK